MRSRLSQITRGNHAAAGQIRLCRSQGLEDVSDSEERVIDDEDERSGRSGVTFGCVIVVGFTRHTSGPQLACPMGDQYNAILIAHEH